MKYTLAKVISGLFLVFFTVNCGSIDQSATDKQKPSASEAKNRSTTDESSKKYSYSQLVDREDNLPICDEEHESELIYVIELSQFKACAKGKWQDIDIGAKDGQKGQDGSDGKDGKDGANGKDGVDGKDGQVVNGNMWYDPVAKKYWLIPSTSSISANEEICTADWRFPTEAEVRTAVERGLKTAADAISAPERAYASTPTSGYYVGRAVRSSGATVGNYCLQK